MKTSHSHDLRLMTYNIHKGIGGIDRRYRLQRIVDTVSHYKPDVVFLQEVDDGVPRSLRDVQVDRLGDALGFEHRAYQANVKLSRGHYGNAILSRFPLSQSWNVDLTVPLKKRRRALVTVAELPITADMPIVPDLQVRRFPAPLPDSLARPMAASRMQPAAAALSPANPLVDPQGQPLTAAPPSDGLSGLSGSDGLSGDQPTTRQVLLSNVHLGLAGYERKIQLRRLMAANAIAGWGPDQPLLLGGDFNDVWGSLGRRLLLPHGLRNASGKTRTFPAIRPLRSLDSIYYRGPLQLQSVFAGRIGLARQASDHLPLIADFRLTTHDR